MPFSYYRKALGNGRSTPILFFIWECLSSKPDKKPKRKESLIKPWSPAFRNLSRPKQNAPSRISNGSKTTRRAPFGRRRLDAFQMAKARTDATFTVRENNLHVETWASQETAQALQKSQKFTVRIRRWDRGRYASKCRNPGRCRLACDRRSSWIIYTFRVCGASGFTNSRGMPQNPSQVRCIITTWKQDTYIIASQ